MAGHFCITDSPAWLARMCLSLCGAKPNAKPSLPRSDDDKAGEEKAGKCTTEGALVVRNGSKSSALPQFAAAMDLFNIHLPCDAPRLRRVYLRLALQYHPDKCAESDRASATQLFQAIAAAYEELLESIVGSRGSTVKTRVKTPVAAAAELGDLEELYNLLEELPSRATELDDLGVCPLMFAAAGGCLGAAEMLVEFGADIHVKNGINWSVLLYAALADDAPMVNGLVDLGARVSEHDLWITSYTGNSRAVEALVDRFEGDVAAVRTDQSKKTLLHLAVEGMCFLKRSPAQHAACVNLLLQRKVPVDFADPFKGRTCLQNYLLDDRWKTSHIGQLELSRPHMSVVEQLCSHGASVSAKDFEGNSAMSIATTQGLHKVIEVLSKFS